MQDHSQQTHKVFVPDLPGMEGIQVKEVPSHPGQWAGLEHTSMEHSRHGSCFSEEGLGSHIALDVLHSHPLPHVLTLQDIWESMGESCHEMGRGLRQ